MRPAELAREAGKEGRCSDRAAGPPADIGHVGEIGAQPFLVFLPERQLPDAVPGVLGGAAQLVGELLVVGEKTGGDMAERDDAGAGERGDIDHHVGFQALSVGEGVAKDQAALRIGVEDLHRLPRERGHHVAGLHGMAAGHVLAGRNDAHDVDRGLHAGERADRAEHAAGARHVELHLVHLARGLDRDAAGIEGNALADQG